MRPIVFLASATMLAATGLSDAATAAPFGTAPWVLDTPVTAIQYRDCHRRTHNHYVPEWDVSAPHHHRRTDCAPIQDENDMGGRRQRYYEEDEEWPRDFRFYPDDDY